VKVPVDDVHARIGHGFPDGKSYRVGIINNFGRENLITGGIDSAFGYAVNIGYNRRSAITAKGTDKIFHYFTRKGLASYYQLLERKGAIPR